MNPFAQTKEDEMINSKEHESLLSFQDKEYKIAEEYSE